MKERLAPDLFATLKEVGQAAKGISMSAYVVGGFVRDLLLGKPTLDVDIVVEGDGIALAKALAEKWDAKLTIHERFMTATLQWMQGRVGAWEQKNSSPLSPLHPCTPANAVSAPLHPCTLGRMDIATARKERYPKPAMLPDVEPSTIAEDLWRRDFSINAMAICLSPERLGELVDPTGGYEDLRQGIIRVLHDKSFVDDPTRIFRAVHYEQRFGFRMERKTLQLLKHARDGNLLTKLTCDRIKHELWRILKEREPSKPIRQLHRLGILQIVAPELNITHRSLAWLEATKTWLDWFALNRPNEPMEREWALLLPLLPEAKAVTQFCCHYQLGERERQAGIAMLNALRRLTPKRPSGFVRWLNPLPLEATLAIAAKRTGVADRKWQRYFLEWRFARPDITGDDLKAHGIIGRAIAVGLQAALAAKLDKNADAKEQLRLALRAARVQMKGG